MCVWGSVCECYSYILSVKKNYWKFLNDFNDSDYICFFDVQNYYGAKYLSDLVLATKYSGGSIITKNCYYSGDGLKLNNLNSEYQYCNEIISDRCLIHKDIYKFVMISEFINNNGISYQKLSNELSKYFKYGEKFFSIDKYNFAEKNNCKYITEIEL